MLRLSPAPLPAGSKAAVEHIDATTIPPLTIVDISIQQPTGATVLGLAEKDFRLHSGTRQSHHFWSSACFLHPSRSGRFAPGLLQLNGRPGQRGTQGQCRRYVEATTRSGGSQGNRLRNGPDRPCRLVRRLDRSGSQSAPAQRQRQHGVKPGHRPGHRGSAEPPRPEGDCPVYRRPRHGRRSVACRPDNSALSRSRHHRPCRGLGNGELDRDSLAQVTRGTRGSLLAANGAGTTAAIPTSGRIVAAPVIARFGAHQLTMRSL